MTSQTRSLLLVGAGLFVVGTIALIAPKVGAIGVGTLLALVIAIVATRSAIQGGHREGDRNVGRRL
jgi:hypothetical protein